MELPSCPEELENITHTYCRWNYPNCFGTTEGKQIAMLKPKHSGPEFDCKKGFSSAVLLTVVVYN